MPVATPIQLIGGAFQDLEGNVLVDGYLRLFLSQDANVAGVGNICAGIYVQIQLDAYGNVSVEPPQYAWGNNQMLPVNTFYKVSGYTAAGQLAFGPNNQQIIGVDGQFDVGTWVPNQVISWVPPLQPLELEVNGTANEDQSILNLYSSDASVTITDEGDGNINLQAASGFSAGSNIFNFPRWTAITSGINGYTVVAIIPASLITATGDSAVLTIQTGNSFGGTGFEYGNIVIAATAASRYIPGFTTPAPDYTWTTAPIAVTFPVGSFTSVNTAYQSNPISITIDTEHDYYLMMFLESSNTASSPYVSFASSGVPAIYANLFGYYTGDHTGDADASNLQTLSGSGFLYHFAGFTIG
jgi:hypothetical protein